MESKDNIIFKDDERSNMDYAMFQEFGGNDLLKKIINEVEELFVNLSPIELARGSLCKIKI